MIEFKPSVDANSGNESRCLTPASVQLLRNLLLLPNNNTVSKRIARSNRNKSTNGSNSNQPNNANQKHIKSRPQTSHDSSCNDNSTTRSIYNNHLQQLQHRTLKRLETEPIPTVRYNPLIPSNGTAHHNDISHTNHSLATIPQQRRRRQIFSTFWDTTTTTSVSSCSVSASTTENHHHRHHEQQVTQHDQEHEINTTRTRSNSCCCVDTVGVATSSSMFVSIPKRSSIHTRSKSDGFQYGNMNDTRYGEQNYKNYYHTMLFASLPSPMQRLRKSSGGVYPLVQPKSILRNRLVPRQISSEDNVVVNVPPPPTPSKDGQPATNMSDDGSTTNTDFDRSSSISSSNNSIHSIPNGSSDIAATAANCDDSSVHRKPLVHFDPRITVTELVGRDHDRVWYSDSELNRFKYETVVTARSYFTQHPDQISYYNQPFYDPVTKTMRKRALFNLPVLSNITITEQDDHFPADTSETDQLQVKKPPASNGSVSHQDQQHLLSLLAFEDGDTILRTPNLSFQRDSRSKYQDSATIRSVLIVDHNRWILDLFVRSVQTMFNGDSKDFNNHVVVECAPNVSVAMAIIESRERQPPFDLVIAEQFQPQLLSQAEVSTTTCHTNDGSGGGAAVVPNTSTSTPSGADLLFHNLPQEHRDQMLLISVAPSPFSMSSNRNKNEVNESTVARVATNTVSPLSDLVWNKPPPRMDNTLRIQLIHKLQKKRERSTQSSKGYIV